MIQCDATNRVCACCHGVISGGAGQRGRPCAQMLTTDDLCKGEDVFFAATGVSDGDLLRGVRYFAGGASSHSLVMRSRSSTIRYITTEHHWNKPGITNVDSP